MNHQKKHLTIFHEHLLPEEEIFYNVIAQIIINYPLLWNNFINNIIAVKAVVATKDGFLIINKYLLDNRQTKVLNQIWSKIEKTNAFDTIISSNDFKIYSCKSRKIIRFFNSNAWLEAIIYYFCIEHDIRIIINPIIINQNLENDLINAYIQYQQKSFLVKIDGKIIQDKYYNTKIINISLDNTSSDLMYNYDYVKFSKDFLCFLKH